jgi:hypothetical protein
MADHIENRQLELKRIYIGELLWDSPVSSPLLGHPQG